MSLRLDMLAAAGRAKTLLNESADRVAEFLRSQFREDGGAANRSGRSDLYYTGFALDGLQALGAAVPVETTMSYLRCFGDGKALDLVHLACLARCWAAMPDDALDRATAGDIARHIESHRCADGGYGPQPGGSTGTVYHGFLATGAYDDLEHVLRSRARTPLSSPLAKGGKRGVELLDAERFARSLSGLQTVDGAYANEHGLRLGTTPATAAAAVLLHRLGETVPTGLTGWLVAQCHPDGGFLAMPHAPFPDLLSTATALHALASFGVSFDGIREPCLDFVGGLWTGRAFRGHMADDIEDCEYTFYGLLALGHLDA